MQAWICRVSLGCFALGAVACSQGDDKPDATGGSTSSGGKASGGSTSSGGGGASNAGAPAAIKTYGFDSGVEGWAVGEPGAKEGATALAKSAIALEHVADLGMPGGALQVDIPYDSAGQYVSVQVNFDTKDLTGRIIKADVKIASGLGEATDLKSAPGGAKLYAKSGEEYVYAAGTYHSITEIGDWFTLEFDMDFTRATPSYPTGEDLEKFDPTLVKEIGIQIDSGAEAKAPEPAQVLIDNVSY